MTLRELIDAIEEENDEILFEKELAFFVKDNPNGTFDAISIHSIGISNEYIILGNKCPNCKD